MHWSFCQNPTVLTIEAKAHGMDKLILVRDDVKLLEAAMPTKIYDYYPDL